MLILEPASAASAAAAAAAAAPGAAALPGGPGPERACVGSWAPVAIRPSAGVTAEEVGEGGAGAAGASGEVRWAGGRKRCCCGGCRWERECVCLGWWQVPALGVGRAVCWVCWAGAGRARVRREVDCVVDLLLLLVVLLLPAAARKREWCDRAARAVRAGLVLRGVGYTASTW